MMMSDAIEDGRRIGQVAYYVGIEWHTQHQHWRRTDSGGGRREGRAAMDGYVYVYGGGGVGKHS